ncbi:MAG: YgfZ/GcvT domain-containing protein [Sphingomonadaceae bacterium]
MVNTILIDRALIRFSGEGVRDFLQGLVTNDVAGALPVWAGLLTPQGKALFDFIIWADGDDLLIDCERDAAGDLAKRLTLYRLRRAITISREETLCVHWSASGEAGVADPRNPALGRRWLAPQSGDVGACENYRAHRLSLGIVEGRAELGSDKILWLECNAREQNGVSFTKGCYVGQENTARMHHRSKVNRRLAVIAAPSDPGDSARIWYPALELAVVHQRIGTDK